MIARDSFNLEGLWQQIEALDNRVDSGIQYQMMLDLMRLIRRSTRWFLRQRSSLSVNESIEHFAPRLSQLQESIGKRLRGDEREAWIARRDELTAAGVPESLANVVAATGSLYAGLGIIEAAKQTNEKIQRVAEVFYEVGHRLELPWMTEQINALTTLSANPIKYLVAPRLIAGVTMMPFLVFIADIIGVFGRLPGRRLQTRFQRGQLPIEHLGFSCGD